LVVSSFFLVFGPPPPRRSVGLVWSTRPMKAQLYRQSVSRICVNNFSFSELNNDYMQLLGWKKNIRLLLRCHEPFLSMIKTYYSKHSGSHGYECLTPEREVVQTKLSRRSARKHRAGLDGAMSQCVTHHKRRIPGAILSVTHPVIPRTASIYRLRNYVRDLIRENASDVTGFT
jgi:hypothetical protein